MEDDGDLVRWDRPGITSFYSRRAMRLFAQERLCEAEAEPNPISRLLLAAMMKRFLGG